MVNCSYCGTEINEGNYCPECGNPLVKIGTKDLDSLIKAKKLERHEKFEKLNKNEAMGLYNIKGHGSENLIYMEDQGLRTGNGLFIPYDKISHIESKKNLSTDKLVGFGLIGLTHGLKDKTVEIHFNGGKIVMRDVKGESAKQFTIAVQNKILNFN